MIAVGVTHGKLANNIPGAPSGPKSFFSFCLYRGLAPTAIVVSSLQDEDRLISNEPYSDAYGRPAYLLEMTGKMLVSPQSCRGAWQKLSQNSWFRTSFVGAVREPPEIRALLEAPLPHGNAMSRFRNQL